MPLLNIKYKKVFYRDSPPDNGSTARETLIFLHGLGSSHNYYTSIVPRLTAESYRCISIDTTGSGLSSYSQVEQSVHSLATDVVDVMDALAIPKAIVIGHSMSGMTAPQMAVMWPDRVSAIILIGPTYPTEAAAQVFQKRIATVEKNGIEAIGDTVPFAAAGSKAKPIHHAFIRTLIMGTSQQGYISLCKVIASAYTSPPEYKKVQCPVLIIAGEDDKSAPLSGCEKIMQGLGTDEKRLEVLQGVGHWHCVEAPEEVGGSIAWFLKEIQ